MIDEPYGPLVSPVEAEDWLGIKASTVRTWHHLREKTGLLAEGRDHVGRPRFLLADLLVLKAKKKIWPAGGGERVYKLADIIGPAVPARTELPDQPE